MVCPHCLAAKQLHSLFPSPRQPPGGSGVLMSCTIAGTNEQAVTDVLTRRSNAQRQQIAKSFKAQFGKVKGGWGRGQVCWGQSGGAAARDSLGGSSVLDEVPV